MLAAIFFVEGCKEPTIEDSSLLTSDDELVLGTADTLSIFTALLQETPQNTGGANVGILGSITDPVFGTTAVSFSSQFRLITNNISFGTSLVLDSCVLSLRYKSLYANFTQPVNVSVYELSQDLNVSTVYYSNSSISVATPPIGKVTGYKPNLKDSTYVYGEVFTPQLRVRLSNDFGNKILFADSAKLVDNGQFLSYIKGLQIKAEPIGNGDGLVGFDLRSAETKITLYYRNSANDSLKLDIPIGISSQCINHFSNNFSATINAFINNDPAVNDSILPVSASAGTKVKVSIPQLDSLPANIAINKAELLIPLSEVYSMYDTIFLPPTTMKLYRLNGSGLEQDSLNVTDQSIQEKNINGKPTVVYRFNITLFVQKLLNKQEKNYGFILKAPDMDGRRVCLSNTVAPAGRIACRIIYTKL
jgi:hypothetical protein